jgi:rare lipoprotein A
MKARLLLVLLPWLFCGCMAHLGRNANIGDTEEGEATFYGRRHHGGPTASGERFNMYALTAAHRTLRFGALVRVENLLNGRQVVVRINDRGPFSRGRIIDLSYAAARIIDMVGAGIVPVRLQVLALPESSR